MRLSAIFYLFWLRSYGLFKVHYCMVVVRFRTFQPFHFGWLQLREEKFEYQKPNDRWKDIFKGYKMRPFAIFFIFFWLRSYGLSKGHYFMVVVGFGTFQHFHFGWLQLCEEKFGYQKPNDRWKELFKGYKMGSTTIFYLYWVRSYAHSKVSLVPSILPYLPLSPLLASVSPTCLCLPCFSLSPLSVPIHPVCPDPPRKVC